MSIREIPNDRMAGLKAPEFVCDECIVPRDIEPLENKAFFLAVLGRPGSGKTSFCVSTLTSRKPKVYYKAFNHLWVFMPPASRKSLKCNPFARLRHVFDDLDYANLTEVFEAIKKQGPQADGSYETNLFTERQRHPKVAAGYCGQSTAFARVDHDHEPGVPCDPATAA